MKFWPSIKRKSNQESAPEITAPLAAVVTTDPPRGEASSLVSPPKPPTATEPCRAKVEPAPQVPHRRLLFVIPSAQARVWLERSLLPHRDYWTFDFANDVAAAQAKLSSAPYDAVVADQPQPMRLGVELVSAVYNQSPSTLRFVRCSPRERGEIKNFQGPIPEFLSSEFDPPTLAEALDRAFQLHDWMQDEHLKKLTLQLRRVPSLPAIYSQVMAELNNPEGSIQMVGKLISKEPALTAKMLQLVNSAVFALPRQIENAEEAVFFLGVERTKSLILLAHSFLHFNQALCPGFSHDHLWRHSLTVSNLAAKITQTETHDPKLADLAFTAGLLHDLGKLLFAANLSAPYSQLLEQATAKSVPHCILEQEVFGATHAEVGACLLGTWGLPLTILQAINWHHQPLKSHDTNFSLVTAVHAADAIEQEKLTDPSGCGPSLMDAAYLHRLDLASQANCWRELGSCAPKSIAGDPRQQIQLRREAKLN